MNTNSTVIRSVSSKILLYSNNEIERIKTILDKVQVSYNGKATLVADTEHSFHIEANGEIKGYSVQLDSDNPDLTGCNFDDFIHDLQSFIDENEPFNDTPDYIYITQTYSDNNVDYILISKDSYNFADFEDIMEIAIVHLDDLD